MICDTDMSRAKNLIWTSLVDIMCLILSSMWALTLGEGYILNCNGKKRECVISRVVKCLIHITNFIQVTPTQEFHAFLVLMFLMWCLPVPTGNRNCLQHERYSCFLTQKDSHEHFKWKVSYFSQL